MIVPLEYVAFLSAMIVFIAQYIYGFGKLTGKVSGLEENVSWIRNYLLCKGANLKLFRQQSPIDFASVYGENILSETWKERLRELKKESPIKGDPFDTAVWLTESIGFPEFANEAGREKIEMETLLIASAIFYTKLNGGKKQNVEVSGMQSFELRNRSV